MSSRLGTWTLGVIGLSLVLILLSRAGAIDPFQNAFLSITSPVQHGLRGVADPVAGWLSNVRDIGDVRSENDSLRAENEQLKNQVATLLNSQSQLQELQRLLQVEQSNPNEQYLTANVLAKDPNSLKEAIAIDRGKRDGLQEGMVVVTEGHSIVGTVTKLFDSYAWVTLVTDPSSAISAMVEESRAEGVVTGSYSRKLSIDFVGQGAVVKNGDTVITSAIGGLYPAGLVIGKVTKVGGGPQDLFESVTLEPLASLSHLETVLVLTSFVPQKLVAP
ncbi:MAG: rod shape-determining protein MreC [Dehalococcoidia bacterium]